MHQHRVVFSYLNDKKAVEELFKVVGPKIVSRPGGYTRIIKLGARVGDNAERAMIELVDFNEVYVKGTAETAASTRKVRRGGGRKKPAAKPNEEASKPEETKDTAGEATPE